MKQKMNSPVLLEDKTRKIFQSKDYNYYFSKVDGLFLRWGETKEDDPTWSPYGPELLDLEISSGGDCIGNCPFCYKGNGGDQPTHNMTLEEFKNIFHKMEKSLTQIAFGIMNISTNPDFFAMMKYAKDNGVIPNYTTHGLDVTDEAVKRTAELCGAVAVSVVNKQKTFESVKKFAAAGMNQVNIHFMLSEETYLQAMELISNAFDKKIKGLNAIIFLQYKAKGRNPNAFHAVRDLDRYSNLVRYAEKCKVPIGFDSCSAPLYMKSVLNRDDLSPEKKKEFISYAEPCESGLFSSYINSRGIFYPCSFMEGEKDWKKGIALADVSSFKEIWLHKEVKVWRKSLLATTDSCTTCSLQSQCRKCPTFDLVDCG